MNSGDDDDDDDEISLFNPRPVTIFLANAH